MPYKDKEKQKEYYRLKYKTDPTIKERNQLWYKNNKEKVELYKHSDKRKKSQRIRQWKKYGVVCEDWDKLYDIYINTKTCDICDVEFVEGIKKCLDHDHEEGYFRGILCNECNWRE